METTNAVTFVQGSYAQNFYHFPAGPGFNTNSVGQFMFHKDVY